MRTLPTGPNPTPNRPTAKPARTASTRWVAAAVAVLHLAFIAAVFAARALDGWLS